ncbi:hypothetical protein ABZ490_49575 [Streptomyces sp. NPDC005811]|uniref:hypothetical protein n=1 Tax=Streptomyces sp. NPDC005811 TaxID=3154565 RepID=UPI0033CC5332
MSAQAGAFLRERGARFAELARDPDPDARLAAIGGLGLGCIARRRSGRSAARLRRRLSCTHC